jgi:A/G-specific adenine glycosylase
MLQQTRVDQGIGYYSRFISAFPTVQDLASAPLDNVLKLWQGLGYYSRARNLHVTAKCVVDEYNGSFPTSYEGLIKLKGVGDYTASAIAAFAFRQPIAAVDGNVYRIFSRYYGVFTAIDTTRGKKELSAIAQEMVDDLQPDIYNQAIMDFGALMCSPKKPQCYDCPLIESCYAFRNGCVDRLPAKSKKIVQRTRYFSYLMIKQGKYTYIRKRQGKDIWHSLYDFPMIEAEKELMPVAITSTKEWKELFGRAKATILHVSDLVKYPLSHQKLMTRFYIVELSSAAYLPQGDFIKIRIADLDQYSTPVLIDSYMAAEAAEKYFTGR